MDLPVLGAREQHRHQPVRRDADRPEEARVGEAGGHVRHDDRVGVHGEDRRLHRPVERPHRRPVRLLREEDPDRHVEIGHQRPHPRRHRLRLLARHDPRVDRPLRRRRDHVRLEPGRERRHRERVPQQRVDLGEPAPEGLQRRRLLRAAPQGVHVEVRESLRAQHPQHVPDRLRKPRRLPVFGHPRHRPRQPRRGVLRRRTAAVPRPPRRGELHPHRPLLPHVQQEELPAAAEDVGHPHAALVHPVRRADRERQVPHEIFRPLASADLLVRVRHEEQFSPQDPAPSRRAARRTSGRPPGPSCRASRDRTGSRPGPAPKTAARSTPPPSPAPRPCGG